MSQPRSADSRYRLVALDLDGTLLDDAGSLSSRTRAAVAGVVARGVIVVLATSRRFTGAAPVAEALNLNGPLILYDGAQIREYPSGAILSSSVLARRTARLAVDAIAAEGLRPIVQYAAASGEHLLVGPSASATAYDREYVGRFSRQITELPLTKLTDDPAPLLRIVAFGPLERLSRAAESVASLPCGWQLLPHGNYGAAELSVFSRGASKGAALLRLAARLHIDARGTLAIGDGINDVSMLSVAGLGVAMGNAAPEVRAVAGAVTAANAEDGAAQALDRYILHSAD
jgi:Cof subfamily protein (haloacid dehalogenase superfamily)